MAWAGTLLELVAADQEERAYSERLAKLVGQLRQDGTPAIKLVEALGPYLTSSEDDAQRARATAVLAEVVDAVPSAASTEGEVQHLALFFTSRLTDWPAVRGALHGSLALLSRHPAAAAADAASPLAAQPQPQLPAPDDAAAVEVMRTCVSHVFVSALAAPDRQLALRLLAAAVRGYGPALLGANLDLLEYTVSSVDGEKDPRCLLLGFEAVRALLALYHAQPDTSLCHERLEEGAEELFEVLACYFPVTFTPPPGDPHRVTRADLAAGLEACLAAEPLFAPYVVPLATEKLSSTLRQAKLDALSLLGACASSYGPSPLAAHVSALWAALRAELAAPAGEGLLPADLAGADELAGATSDTLARCVAAFQQRPADGGGSGEPASTSLAASLADAVLADPCLSDMLACILAPGTDPAMHRRSALRAKAGARAARALCATGGAAAAKALAQLLPPLLEAIGEQAVGDSSSSGSWQSRCLAWAAAVELLEALAAAPAEAKAAASGPTGALLQQLVAAAAASLAAAASVQLSAAAAMEEDGAVEASGRSAAAAERWPLHPSDCSQQHTTALQLAALATVFGDERQMAVLQQPQLEAAMAATLQLLSATGSSAQRRQAAVAPLTALAGSSRAAVLAEDALPQLITAAGRQQSAGTSLAALQALATASSSLRLEIVVALDQAIQQQLPVAIAAAPSAGACNSAALLKQLLAATTAIVSAADAAAVATPAAEPAAAAAGGFVRLGQHLLDAVLMLPQQAADMADTELATACAELAFHSVRNAPAEHQLPLAAAAAAALQEQQQPAGLQAAVCCALLVPLQPAAANACAGGGQLAALVQHLVQVAVAQPKEGPVGVWAALAAAALLNKWAADAGDVSACASTVLSQQLYPACGLAGGNGLPTPAPAAWGCLASVTQGLAMRGHKEADSAVVCVIACLDAAAQCWQQPQQQQPGVGRAAGATAAAGFMGAVLGGGSGGGSAAAAGLSRQAHAVTKPLWQQRLYTAAANQLLPLLLRSQQAASASSGSASQQDPQQDPRPSLASPVLLLALGNLLRAAPGAVLQQDQQRMLPWMLQCLTALQAGPLADGELLLALLLLVSSALMSDTGKRQAEAELLPRLMPALLGLSAFRPSPAVRETALQCLLLLVELPYTALHSYRRTVATALAAAVDDDRRVVRLQAARCRQAWLAA